MKIYWATKMRGFLRNLDGEHNGITFSSEGNFYETKSKFKKLLAYLIHFKIFDILGAFQRIKVTGKDCDLYASFNRFLDCDKPYVIYLETPTALYHYSLDRLKYKIGRLRYKKYMDDPNLKAIVCMSNACKDTFEILNGKINSEVKLSTIYPYVPCNKYINNDEIIKKSKSNTVELLFSTQGVNFVSKGGLEILSAYENIFAKYGEKLHLTIVTKLDELEIDVKNRLFLTEGITLHDFNLNHDEMEKVYAKTNILLHPTSHDSSPLTILEALKAGCVIFSTKMYTIKEMVFDGENGFLTEPKYWYYNENNLPNPKIWKYPKNTIHSKVESERLVNWMVDKVSELVDDRKKLVNMALNAYESATTGKFSESYILEQWNELSESILGGGYNYITVSTPARLAA